MAQARPEWTGDFGQLYIAIKAALGKSTFLLAPPKQADTVIICIPQAKKSTIAFKSREGEIVLVEVTKTWIASKSRADAGS